MGRMNEDTSCGSLTKSFNIDFLNAYTIHKTGCFPIGFILDLGRKEDAKNQLLSMGRYLD